MKLLVLYQARDAAKDQPGYYHGFERLVSEGILASHVGIPYGDTSNWNAVWEHVLSAARRIGPDAVFLQFFHGPIPDPSEGLQRIRQIASSPMIFTSLGDPFGRWTNRMPDSFCVASKLSDLTFLTGMGYLARQLESKGSRNLVLMPNGCCQVRFSASAPPPASNPEFDVVFVGNRIRSHNPIGHFFWAARKREELIASLTRRFGRRFGLFGNGWTGNPVAQGPVPYNEQHNVYRQSAVVVGGMPNGYHDYYTSDRVFIAAASGVPLIDYWIPGVDRILQPQRDWWLGHCIRDILRLCDQMLELSSSERTSLGETARRHILAAHTQYHRCREMISIVSDLRIARQSGRHAFEPNLDFLLKQNAPIVSDLPAIMAWQG